MNKAPTRPMYREEGTDYVLGYMCLIDFECELGGNADGNHIYPTAEECRKGRKCTKECGVVEVKVEATKIIQRVTL